MMCEIQFIEIETIRRFVECIPELNIIADGDQHLWGLEKLFAENKARRWETAGLGHDGSRCKHRSSPNTINWTMLQTSKRSSK